MAAPNKNLYQTLAKTIFTSKAIKVPVNFSKPNDQFDDAFDLTELIHPPAPPDNLFREATLNKYHVDAAKDVGKSFADFIDAMCGAVCDGISQWQATATMAGVMINAVVGVVTPGCVIGPPLTPLILALAPKKTPQEMKYSMAVASAFGNAWLTWSTGLTGQILYPAFAAVPSPVAPPMPNVPMPLVAFTSPGEAQLAPATLKQSMVGLHGDPTALHSDALFDAFAQGFSPVFNLMKVSTQVKNVLGTGPVPTFAPPFVPVGPVIGGIGTGPPGCLA